MSDIHKTLDQLTSAVKSGKEIQLGLGQQIMDKVAIKINEVKSGAVTSHNEHQHQKKTKTAFQVMLLSTN